MRNACSNSSSKYTTINENYSGSLGSLRQQNSGITILPYKLKTHKPKTFTALIFTRALRVEQNTYFYLTQCFSLPSLISILSMEPVLKIPLIITVSILKKINLSLRPTKIPNYKVYGRSRKWSHVENMYIDFSFNFFLPSFLEAP